MISCLSTIPKVSDILFVRTNKKILNSLIRVLFCLYIEKAVHECYTLHKEVIEVSMFYEKNIFKLDFSIFNNDYDRLQNKEE